MDVNRKINRFTMTPKSQIDVKNSFDKETYIEHNTPHIFLFQLERKSVFPYLCNAQIRI